jgi:hypothetical protein
MAWPEPNVIQLGNIIYNATSGMREAASSFRADIRNARIGQGIAIINRARQEVGGRGNSPGWGTGHGTESAGVTTAADPAIIAECRAAAQVAIRRCSHLPVTGYAVDPTVYYFHSAYLYGAQFYRHSFSTARQRWKGDVNTHLVAHWGPLQNPAFIARCRRDHGDIAACRGYFGVYVNTINLGKAFASQELNCPPSLVPGGAVRRRHRESAERIPWSTLVRHNPSL